MLKWLMTLCIVALLGAHDAQAVQQVAFYRVKPGDTLSTVFGKEDTAKVCQLNKKLGKIKDCDVQVFAVVHSKSWTVLFVVFFLYNIL